MAHAYDFQGHHVQTVSCVSDSLCGAPHQHFLSMKMQRTNKNVYREFRKLTAER